MKGHGLGRGELCTDSTFAAIFRSHFPDKIKQGSIPSLGVCDGIDVESGRHFHYTLCLTLYQWLLRRKSDQMKFPIDLLQFIFCISLDTLNLHDHWRSWFKVSGRFFSGGFILVSSAFLECIISVLVNKLKDDYSDGLDRYNKGENWFYDQSCVEALKTSFFFSQTIEPWC